jgi:hypothetical protein
MYYIVESDPFDRWARGRLDPEKRVVLGGYSVGAGDFEALMEALQNFTEEYAATPEQAFLLLQEEGVLTKDGKVTEAYSEKV